MLKSKIILLALFSIGAVVADKNHTKAHHQKGEKSVKSDYIHGNHTNSNHTKKDSCIEKTPGCENATSVKNYSAKSCCPSLPTFFNKDLWKNCSATGEREDDCAKYACVLKASNVTNKDGKFDEDIAIATLNAAVGNDPSWPMGTIVDKCVARAPADVKAWQERMAAMNETMPACPNLQSFLILKCLRRSLILSCPNWMATKNCSALMKFAQRCPLYPFREDNQVQKRKSKAVGGKKAKKV